MSNTKLFDKPSKPKYSIGDIAYCLIVHRENFKENVAGSIADISWYKPSNDIAGKWSYKVSGYAFLINEFEIEAIL